MMIYYKPFSVSFQLSLQLGLAVHQIVAQPPLILATSSFMTSTAAVARRKKLSTVVTAVLTEDATLVWTSR